MPIALDQQATFLSGLKNGQAAFVAPSPGSVDWMSESLKALESEKRCGFQSQRSIATFARVSKLSSRDSATNCAQTLRIAPPVSLRKSAIVLWSGMSRPSSHITSTLRPASRSSRRLDCRRSR